MLAEARAAWYLRGRHRLCIALVVKALLGPTYRHSDALTPLCSYKMRIVQAYFLSLHTYRSLSLSRDQHVFRRMVVRTSHQLDPGSQPSPNESYRGSTRRRYVVTCYNAIPADDLSVLDVSGLQDGATNTVASTPVCHSDAHSSPHLSVPTPPVSRASRKRSISSLDGEGESPLVHNGAGHSNVAPPTCIAPQLTLLSHSAPPTSDALVPTPTQGVASSSRTPTSQVVSGGYTSAGSGPLPGGSANGPSQGRSTPRMPLGLEGLIPDDVPGTWSFTTTMSLPEAPQSSDEAAETTESTGRPNKRRRIAHPTPSVPAAPPQPSTSRAPHRNQAIPQPPVAPQPVRAVRPAVAGGNIYAHTPADLPVPRGTPVIRGPSGPPLLQVPAVSSGRAHSAGPMHPYRPAPAPISRARTVADHLAAWGMARHSNPATGGATGMGHPSVPPPMQAQKAQAASQRQSGRRRLSDPPTHFAVRLHVLSISALTDNSLSHS